MKHVAESDGVNIRGTLKMGVQTIASILKAKGPQVHSVRPGATAYDAVAEMAANDITAVLVVEYGELLGVFTGKDYVSRILLQGRDGRAVAVRDAMTHPVVAVRPDVKIVEAMQIMTTKGLRHLPIVAYGEPIGLVTLADLARSTLADQEFQIEQLMSYVGS
jgi:CBS domain-containing protein